jgi:hypothetical protein
VLAVAAAQVSGPAEVDITECTGVRFAGELFTLTAGTDLVHVPHRGRAGAYPDLMSGKACLNAG